MLVSKNIRRPRLHRETPFNPILDHPCPLLDSRLAILDQVPCTIPRPHLVEAVAAYAATHRWTERDLWSWDLQQTCQVAAAV